MRFIPISVYRKSTRKRDGGTAELNVGTRLETTRRPMETDEAGCSSSLCDEDHRTPNQCEKTLFEGLGALVGSSGAGVSCSVDCFDLRNLVKCWVKRLKCLHTETSVRKMWVNVIISSIDSISVISVDIKYLCVIITL